MSSATRGRGHSPAASSSQLESRALLDAIPDLIWLKNTEGIYLDCNLAVEHILGTEKSDIIGKTDYAFLDRNQADLFREQDSKACISDKPLSNEEWLSFGRDGQRRLYETTKTPMHDVSGKLIGILSISRDITKREQHRETLVREVHHRIKNNLQGLAGLLQRELGKFKDIDSRLNAAISQINSIAVVHALQAIHPGEGVSPYANISDICRMVSELALRPVQFHCKDEQNAVGLFRVNHQDANSIALVLNELVLNALKHSPPDCSTPIVKLLADGTGVKLVIRNAVTGVPEFNFDTNYKLGTGLSLVRSLLPKQGAQLNYQYDSQSGFMLTTLCLTAPVVNAM